MKNIYTLLCAFSFIFAGIETSAQTETKTTSRKTISELQTKAEQWVASLELKDEKKEKRVEKVITDHLITVREWHNAHPFSEVPEGINPKTGDKLKELDRLMISHSAKPDSIHENFMSGLRNDLSEEQTTAILDKYTVGKVDFTMRGYEAIVPNLTNEESKHIRGLMESAREQAVDYKNMEEISAIFEIYKTKAENYLNSNGRNWKQMYKDYANRNK